MKKNSILSNIFILIINFWNYYKYTKKFFKLMTKSIYFFVTYSRKQKENDSDIEFVISEKNNLKPSCIYKEEKFEGQRFYYNKIFAFEKSKKKKLQFHI